MHTHTMSALPPPHTKTHTYKNTYIQPEVRLSGAGSPDGAEKGQVSVMGEEQHQQMGGE